MTGRRPKLKHHRLLEETKLKPRRNLSDATSLVKRPTEIVAGGGLFYFALQALTDNGWQPRWAVLIAGAVATVPWLVSKTIDKVERDR